MTPDQREDGEVRPGDVIAGKYRVERILGSGGAGVVVAAAPLAGGAWVAIKLLLPGTLDHPGSVARFQREARAAGKIKSEHVARVVDVGTLETGAPYMAMEFLAGEDLAHRVKVRGALPIAETVTFVIEACEALAEAHSQGIIHRDLKPANLFVTTGPGGGPTIKVLDFGISKVRLAGVSVGGNLTAQDTLLGSPLYMSPEQMSSPKTVDHRADVWSLGATLFLLLTGKPPFDGDSIPQICGMMLLRKPPLLTDQRPDAPAGLAEVINRCLQRQRDDRWSNVGELAAALAPFALPSARAKAERVQQILRDAGPIPVPASASLPPPPPLRPPVMPDFKREPSAAWAPAMPAFRQEPPAPRPPAAAPASRRAPTVRKRAHPPPRPRWLLVVAGVLLGGAVAGGLVGALMALRRDEGAAAPPTASTIATAVSPPQAPATATAVTAVPSATASAAPAAPSGSARRPPGKPAPAARNAPGKADRGVSGEL
jgi:serine/threonine-protein kinase